MERQEPTEFILDVFADPRSVRDLVKGKFGSFLVSACVLLEGREEGRSSPVMTTRPLQQNINFVVPTMLPRYLPTLPFRGPFVMRLLSIPQSINCSPFSGCH
jgi:hypothetical protein